MTTAVLIISAIVFAPLVLFMCVMLLTYFMHPDDKNEAYVPKFVVVCEARLCTLIDTLRLRAFSYPLARCWYYPMM